MRCYKVTVIGPETDIITGLRATRYSATNAMAREMREALMEEFGVRKKDVEIEQMEVPTVKEDLLDFLNTMLSLLDRKEVGSVTGTEQED